MLPHVSDMNEEAFPPCLILFELVQLKALWILELGENTELDSALTLERAVCVRAQ